VTVYDLIGAGYRTTRRPDPRIAAQVASALSGMASVVNVGAGAGSYEPAGTVVAVEPSSIMIGQRPPAGGGVRPRLGRGATPARRGGRRRARGPDRGAAYWRRPAAYLDPGVRAGISMLAQADQGALVDGLSALAADLASGAWQERHADLADPDRIDAGYRLIVSDRAVRSRRAPAGPAA
jgi:hypothetical protein